MPERPEAVCRWCHAPILWIYTWPKGSRMPLEHEAVPVPNVRLVAFNRETGKGKVLTEADVTPDRHTGVMPAERWAAAGEVTFHRSHFTSKRCKQLQKEHDSKKETTTA